MRSGLFFLANLAEEILSCEMEFIRTFGRSISAYSNFGPLAEDSQLIVLSNTNILSSSAFLLALVSTSMVSLLNTSFDAKTKL